MTAPSLSPESERELAALRRRAYGPGADIHDDADALVRLQTLESLSRPGTRAEAVVPVHDDLVLADAATATASTETAPTAQAPSVEETPTAFPSPRSVASVTAVGPAEGRPDQTPAPAEHVVTPASPGRVRRAWSATPRWIIAIGCLGVGVASGIGILALTEPQPTARLALATAPSGQEPPLFLVAGALTWFGLENADLHPHEPYGDLSIYSARNNRGEDCLFIAANTDWMGGGCAPTELGPVVDVPYDAGIGVVRDPAFSSGGFLRLTLDGTFVLVWIHEGSGAAVAAS